MSLDADTRLMAEAAERAAPGTGFVLLVFGEGQGNFASNVPASPELIDRCRQVLDMMERQCLGN